MASNVVVQFGGVSADFSLVKEFFTRQFNEEFPEDSPVSVKLYCVPENNRVYCVIDGNENFGFKRNAPLDLSDFKEAV